MDLFLARVTEDIVDEMEESEIGWLAVRYTPGSCNWTIFVPFAYRRSKKTQG